MGQGNGFVGVVCVAYLIGGFILGGVALALQTVVYQFAKDPKMKTAPLKVGLTIWIAMIVTKLVGVHGFIGALAAALYNLFGGWVYPYDLIAFAMSTVPILAGLTVGLVVCRGKKEGSQ